MISRFILTSILLLHSAWQVQAYDGDLEFSFMHVLKDVSSRHYGLTCEQIGRKLMCQDERFVGVHFIIKEEIQKNKTLINFETQGEGGNIFTNDRELEFRNEFIRVLLRDITFNLIYNGECFELKEYGFSFSTTGKLKAYCLDKDNKLTVLKVFTGKNDQIEQVIIKHHYLVQFKYL